MSSTPYDQIPSVFNQAAFHGRVYGVTGSAHGIGEATVKELAKLGASVVVIDVDKPNLRRVEKDLKALNASALCLDGDVADDRALKSVIRMAHKKWGRIDGWVNNAMYNPGHQPDSLPARDLERTWEVNIRAAWVAIGLLTPIMKTQGGGSLINISSIMAHLPQSNNAAYAMAKAALEGMTRSLAVDLAPIRVRVNAIVPGAINTHYAPRHFQVPRGVPASALKRTMELRAKLRDHNWRFNQAWPEQGQARFVADVILFLLSDAARFITGECLNVDGGGSTYRPWFWNLDLKETLRDMQAHRRLLKKYPELRMRNLLRAHKKRLRGKLRGKK